MILFKAWIYLNNSKLSAIIMYNTLIIKEKIKQYLMEDCNYKDISSFIIPEKESVRAKIIAKSSGYISGLEELKILYDLLGVTVKLHKNDGDSFKKGEIIAILTGNGNAILLGERLALNLLTHMSAITSTTKKYVTLVKNAGKKSKIACTRKTLPGLRIFEKKAVELGGGDPHRFSLDDMVLLKDTHLKYYEGDVKRLLHDTMKKVSFTKKIEIEIEKVEDVITAARNGANIIMLDNMYPNEVKEAITLLKKEGVRNNVLIEISGGINENNIKQYVEAEPDIISMGHLTQFPSVHVDLSLRFE
ncbi:MAG: carboxylating nicotinate-nucleotide diphosphorylase [Promethearchaeota archaeon]